MSTLAFALLIGGQFLAAIILISKRKAIYGEAEEAKPQRDAAEQIAGKVSKPGIAVRAN